MTNTRQIADVSGLRSYLRAMSKTDRESFALSCGTTSNYLNQILNRSKCSAALAIAIDRESQGRVRCDDLCPDVDFDYLRMTKANVA